MKYILEQPSKQNLKKVLCFHFLVCILLLEQMQILYGIMRSQKFCENAD